MPTLNCKTPSLEIALCTFVVTRTVRSPVYRSRERMFPVETFAPRSKNTGEERKVPEPTCCVALTTVYALPCNTAILSSCRIRKKLAWAVSKDVSQGFHSCWAGTEPLTCCLGYTTQTTNSNNKQYTYSLFLLCAMIMRYDAENTETNITVPLSRPLLLFCLHSTTLYFGPLHGTVNKDSKMLAKLWITHTHTHWRSIFLLYWWSHFRNAFRVTFSFDAVQDIIMSVG